MKNLIIFTVIICLGVFLGSGIWPLAAQDARTAAAGDSILTLPPSAFAQYKDGYDFYNGSSLRFNSGSGEFRAPVNLPSGSVIKKVILICKDNNGSENINLLLFWLDQSGIPEKIVSVSSSGTGTDYRTFSKKLTSKKYVNTWKHSHYLKVDLPGTGSDGYLFSQAKIVYTPPSP